MYLHMQPSAVGRTHAFAVELAGTLQRICVAESTSALTTQSPNLHASSIPLATAKQRKRKQTNTGVGAVVELGRAFAS